MSRVIAACRPSTDPGFVERVNHVIGDDRWDLESPEGVALFQAVLRERYELATVVLRDGIWAGGVRRTVVLDVFRDGSPQARTAASGWIAAVYDHSATDAYRAAARLVSERKAERVVEQAFRELPAPPRGMASVEEAGAAVIASSIRLATDEQRLGDERSFEPIGRCHAQTALANDTLRRHGVRRRLSIEAIAVLSTVQRTTLELALLADLKVDAIAGRMQTTPGAVSAHVGDALRAVRSGVRPTSAATLARLRAATDAWAAVPSGDPQRAERSRAVANAWLDHQAATHAVADGTTVVVTDADRRFVATSAGAAEGFGKPSLVGLHIDDVTAHHLRPAVPELWETFDAIGAMAGDYECDGPDGALVRMPFQGVWGRPIPDLQVGYLQPHGAVRA